MIKLLFLILIFISQVYAKKILIVSIPPQKYFVEQIAKDDFTVKYMVDDNSLQDIYIPRAKNYIWTEDAYGYIKIGMHDENLWLKKIKIKNPNIRVYNSIKGIKLIDEDEMEREEKEDDLLNIFLFVLILSFGIFSLLAGIFTAYFGAGKSRAIGGVLLLIGIIIILIWLYFGVMQDYPEDSILQVVHWEAAKTLEAFITVLGAIIGALVAIGVFLLAIMKS